MPDLPPLCKWESTPGKPIAAVHILHGMAEHRLRYQRFADALNAANIVVWAHDHRGHGDNITPGIPSDQPVGLGHFADHDGWRLLIEDARAVSESLQKAWPKLPLVLFAHSMGSFAAQSLMAEHGSMYRAVVLSGTNGKPGFLERASVLSAWFEYKWRGPRNRAKTLNHQVFSRFNQQFCPNRTDFDWLSRDEHEVDLYIDDCKCGFALTTRSWLDFLAGRKRLGDLKYLSGIPKQLPVHIICGECDPVGENTAGVRRLLDTYAELGLAHVDAVFYPNARHELLNETNRREVTDEVIAWIQQTLSSET